MPSELTRAQRAAWRNQLNQPYYEVTFSEHTVSALLDALDAAEAKIAQLTAATPGGCSHIQGGACHACVNRLKSTIAQLTKERDTLLKTLLGVAGFHASGTTARRMIDAGLNAARQPFTAAADSSKALGD